eukprot:g469.t1
MISSDTDASSRGLFASLSTFIDERLREMDERTLLLASRLKDEEHSRTVIEKSFEKVTEELSSAVERIMRDMNKSEEAVRLHCTKQLEHHKKHVKKDLASQKSALITKMDEHGEAHRANISRVQDDLRKQHMSKYTELARDVSKIDSKHEKLKDNMIQKMNKLHEKNRDHVQQAMQEQLKLLNDALQSEKEARIQLQERMTELQLARMKEHSAELHKKVEGEYKSIHDKVDVMFEAAADRCQVLDDMISKERKAREKMKGTLSNEQLEVLKSHSAALHEKLDKHASRLNDHKGKTEEDMQLLREHMKEEMQRCIAQEKQARKDELESVNTVLDMERQAREKLLSVVDEKTANIIRSHQDIFDDMEERATKRVEGLSKKHSELERNVGASLENHAADFHAKLDKHASRLNDHKGKTEEDMQLLREHMKEEMQRCIAQEKQARKDELESVNTVLDMERQAREKLLSVVDEKTANIIRSHQDIFDDMEERATKRVEGLSKKHSELERNVGASLENHAAEFHAKIDKHAARLSDHKGNIDLLARKHSDLEKNLGASLESHSAAFHTKLDQHASRLSDHKGNIDLLAKKHSDLEKNLDSSTMQLEKNLQEVKGSALQRLQAMEQKHKGIFDQHQDEFHSVRGRLDEHSRLHDDHIAARKGFEKLHDSHHEMHKKHSNENASLGDRILSHQEQLAEHVDKNEKLFIAEREARDSLAARVREQQQELAVEQMNRIDVVLASEKRLCTKILMQQCKEQVNSYLEASVKKIRRELNLPGVSSVSNDANSDFDVDSQSVDKKISVAIRSLEKRMLNMKGITGDGSGNEAVLKQKLADCEKHLEESQREMSKMREGMKAAGEAVKRTMAKAAERHEGEMKKMVAEMRKMRSEHDKAVSELKAAIMKVAS